MDMIGNVAEWCADFYVRSYYAESPVDDPVGPESGAYRAVRGGSFTSRPVGVRSAARSGRAPADVGSYIGFRICRAAP